VDVIEELVGEIRDAAHLDERPDERPDDRPDEQPDEPLPPLPFGRD
jgi:hypothetical protein